MFSTLFSCQALAGAKEVHMYGRDADDTLDWIQEKVGIVSSDDFGHDLESVQALISRHDGLEVKANRQKMHAYCENIGVWRKRQKILLLYLKFYM